MRGYENGRALALHALQSLRPRYGPRPRTQRFLPHKQLDQWTNPAMFQKLAAVCMTLPDVRDRQSRMAGNDTHALWLPDETAGGPEEAFIDDHEFCHLHALPEGHLHLTLPSGPREHVIRLGWAEWHPSAEAGLIEKTVIMVYAPRNEEELTVVLTVVRASYEFATGNAALGSGA